MTRALTAVFMLLTLAACTSDRMDPAGGGGNNTGGTGGPTTPGPVDTTGTIGGTVTAANAGVAGAVITLAQSSQTTSATGQYAFANVAGGTHSVAISSPSGFTLAAGETAAKSTTVSAGQTSTVNWTLVQTAAAPQIVEISLDASAFRPADVTLARGDTVRWVNAQPISHNVTPDSRTQPGVWRTEDIPDRKGAAFSHVFNSEGIFTYSCTLHVGMRGVVRVR